MRGRTLYIAALLLIIMLHVAASAYRMPTRFDDEPGAGAFGGIRLFYLKAFNLDFSKGVSGIEGTSHILDNFIKSFVSGTHGLLDFLHWYVYIAVYTLLGIPINEFWLLFGQTAVMACAILVIALLMERLYDSRLAALSFAILSSVLYIDYSRSFYIIPPNTLTEGLLLWAIYLFIKGRPGFWASSPLAVLLFLNSASGNIIKLPLYLLFAWCADCKVTGYGPFRSFKERVIKRPSNLLFIAPVLIAVAGHLYVYKRIGTSNLGMLGWISQKIGLGAPMASKFAMLNLSLEKLIFAKAIDWWGIFVLAVFYAITALRARRMVPLVLFPLAYYIYLINLEPNSALMGYVMLVSVGIYGMFLTVGKMADAGTKRLSRVFASIFAVYVLGGLLITAAVSAATRQECSPNFLKSTGYFLREHMGPEDKIASLLSDRQNILNEYYYGKTFFKSPVFGKQIYDYRNLAEPESPANPVSVKERDTEFPFYVVLSEGYKKDKGYKAFVDGLIKRYSLKKVADICDRDMVYVSVYSSRPIRYEKLQVKDANRRFDEKYARIKTLFYNRHVGVASTWGFY